MHRNALAEQIPHCDSGHWAIVSDRRPPCLILLSFGPAGSGTGSVGTAGTWSRSTAGTCKWCEACAFRTGIRSKMREEQCSSLDFSQLNEVFMIEK